MKGIFLEDLSDLTEDGVKKHLALEYGFAEYGEIDNDVYLKLKDLSVLIAYESVGSWGCDSSSFFLFSDKSGNLFELHGGHCSCYGFEEQFELEQTTKEFLKHKAREGFFFTGGYDENEESNIKAVYDFIFNL